MTAKEFRDKWQRQNPKTVHIPSEFELGLMEAYAEYCIAENKLRDAIENLQAVKELKVETYPEELIGMIAEEISGSGKECCGFIEQALSVFTGDMLKQTKEYYGFYD